MIWLIPGAPDTFWAVANEIDLILKLPMIDIEVSQTSELLPLEKNLSDMSARLSHKVVHACFAPTWGNIALAESLIWD